MVEILGAHFHIQRAAHGFVAGFGAAVEGGVGDEVVGCGADVEDERGGGGGCEARDERALVLRERSTCSAEVEVRG